MGLPLIERKALLRELLPHPADRQSLGEPSALMYVSHLDAADHPLPVSRLYAYALEHQLEGVVAKHVQSTYEPGARTSKWLKFKRPGAIPPGRFDRRSVR